MNGTGYTNKKPTRKWFHGDKAKINKEPRIT